MNPQNKQQNIMDAVNNARPDQLDIQTTRRGDVQMNVVNAVNANGVVSGRKVVDYIWQRIAICAMIIAVGCIAAVLVMVVIANNYNTDSIRLTTDRDATQNRLNEMYTILGVSSHADAVTKIVRDETVDGKDIKDLQTLLSDKYGSNVKVDFTDDALNFIKKSGRYKVASFQVSDGTNSERVLMYAKDGATWAISKYNPADKDNPCKDMSAEEKDALYDIALCPKEQQ